MADPFDAPPPMAEPVVPFAEAVAPGGWPVQTMPYARMGDLRPMSIGDILDKTFRLYKANAVRFIVICLIVYIPFSVCMGVFMTIAGSAGAFDPAAFDDPTAGPSLDMLVGMLVTWMGMILLLLVVLPLCQGALLHLISAIYLGSEITAWEAYRRAGPRLLTLVGTQILAGLVIMGGYILLFVPGVICTLWFMLISCIVMLEHRGGTDALKRSRELMRGNLGKGFALLLVTAILATIIEFGLAMPFMLLFTKDSFFGYFMQFIVGAIAMPIRTAPIILLYYDLQIRKEAFDLERLSSSLGLAPPSAT